MAFSSAHVFLIILAAERGIEQVISRRNEIRIKKLGGEEHGAAFTRVLFGFHVPCFFPSAWKRPQRMQRSSYLRHRPFWCFCFFKPGVIGASSASDDSGTQRYCGPRGRTCSREPILFFKHPNYAVVSLEIFIYPAIFGCWITALVFGLSNIFVLKKRIRQEEAALGI